MRRLVLLCVLLCGGIAGQAAADPLLFGTGHFVTAGTFNCFNLATCSASGSSVTLGAGPGAVTLTFTGADVTFPVTNAAVPVALGTLASSSAGAAFPPGINPNIPIAQLVFRLSQDAPVDGTGRLFLSFGPGGGSELSFMQGNTYMRLPPGPVPPGYGGLVYTLSPDDFFLPLNGSVTLTANAGVVPEPGTIALVGSGLLLAWRARRRRAFGSRRTGAHRPGAS